MEHCFTISIEVLKTKHVKDFCRKRKKIFLLKTKTKKCYQNSKLSKIEELWDQKAVNTQQMGFDDCLEEGKKRVEEITPKNSTELKI